MEVIYHRYQEKSNIRQQTSGELQGLEMISSERQDTIIARIRSAKLLSDDEALLVPSAMAVKLLASQIRQSRQVISRP